MGVFMLVSILFFSSYIPMKRAQHTEEKLFSLAIDLYFEKEDTNEYPYDINCFVNTSNNNALIDGWGNALIYDRLDNGKEYLLLSKGKDGVLFTDDDISRNSKDTWR